MPVRRQIQWLSGCGLLIHNIWDASEVESVAISSSGIATHKVPLGEIGQRCGPACWKRLQKLAKVKGGVVQYDWPLRLGSYE